MRGYRPQQQSAELIEADSDEDFPTEYNTEDSGFSDNAIVDFKKSNNGMCRPCFNAKCCCHLCYIIQFSLYIVVFPLWCKYLVTAPMPYNYWNEEWPKFPLIKPISKTEIALLSDADPQIVLTPVPKAESACDYSCSKELHGYQTDEMNFPLRMNLNMSKNDAHAHTLFPVILTSSDFKTWQLAADRRNAVPEPFWRSRSSFAGQGYEKVTDSCSKRSPVSLGLRSTYLLACITWRPTALNTLRDTVDPFNATDLADLCDSVGGVCGWPCGSFMPSSRLPACSQEGLIDVQEFAKKVAPNAKFAGKVTVQACENSDPKERCQTGTQELSRWKCHKCVEEVVAGDEGDNDLDGGIGDEGGGTGGLPSLPGIASGPSGLPPLRRLKTNRTRRAAKRKLQDDDDTKVVYRSLPRMMVKLNELAMPQGINVLTTPRMFLLTAPSLESSWQKLYAETDPQDPEAPSPPRPFDTKPKSKKPDGTPIKVEDPDDSLTMDPDIKHSMQIDNLNELDIEPKSCYGRRGPMYVVACAVNASTYNDGDFKRFEMGQAVAPPPFNDRCLAVTGRCGQACMAHQESIPYCLPNGYINQSHLVGEIEIQDNKQLPVYMFVYVLLFGFCVKVVMLCPGIFSPYPHFRSYNADLTDQIRYIATCTPSTAGDENKSVTMRNIIGCISAMPRNLHCRYHVCLLDETHRAEMKVCFEKLGGVINAIPSGGGSSYQDNITDFFGAWCEETKKLDLNKIGGKAKTLDPSIMDRICGKAAYRKMWKESNWSQMDPNSLKILERALDVFEADIAADNKWTRIIVHRDDVLDWVPRDKYCMLRMHYIARAKPFEDERTNRVQHVAPGTWYYKVPTDATLDQWLVLRQDAKEMVYGRDDLDNDDKHIVPLRTSRGKAGGLNFVENYLVVVNERPENAYHTEQDDAPCLFSIADARHQFQHDFMASTLPYFFSPEGVLDTSVAFTQCPQHFHESQDKTDYLDTNNASFFRLNCMIRNCSGGVSSCGTNGTWMIKHRENATIWETERVRVRDSQNTKRFEVIERRTFHESCKVEDTASSLQAVVAGRHSQFINRKLSYGMAKAAVGYLAATQRWAEGGVVLSLQTLTSCEKGHWMVFVTLLFFAGFVFSLCRLVTLDVNTWLVVKLGLVSQKTMDIITIPMYETLNWFVGFLWENNMLGTGIKDHKIYTMMAMQMVMWLLMLIVCLFMLWCLTSFCKIFRRRFCIFPDQLRWCGRLLITMDNLTYFVWFWTAFFWIGFNYYTALTRSHYHFQFEGMMLFMGCVNVLNWGMIIANAFRYSLEQSMEANEIAHLSMDNIWRSNQLFYMTAPVQLFSILVGCKEFIRYQFYGIDISFWEGGDRGDAAIKIVKFWTLLLVIGPFIAWTCYIVFAHKYLNAWAACVVVSIIGADVLHPCAYLWIGDSSLTREESQKMSWPQALSTFAWWKRKLYLLILNDTLSGILKYVGPAYFLLLPISCLTTTYFGVNAAFMMVAGTQLR